MFPNGKGLTYISVITALGLMLSCAPEANQQDDAQSSEVVDDAEEMLEAPIEDQVHYQIPSPQEMIDFMQDGGFEFNSQLLLDPNKTDAFVDTKAKALNLGFYAADLVYASSYGELQHSVNCFNAINKLADELGIASAFDNALKDRIKNNLDHPDSLQMISDDSYYKIIDELEQGDRGMVVAMIAAGGWLESVYIVLSSMDKFDPQDPMIQRLADQKLIFENIMLNLEKYKGTDAIDWTIGDFGNLQYIFDAFEEDVTNTELKQGEGKRRVLGGSGKISINREHYDALQDKVIFLREAIALNIENN